MVTTFHRSETLNIYDLILKLTKIFSDEVCYRHNKHNPRCSKITYYLFVPSHKLHPNYEIIIIEQMSLHGIIALNNRLIIR